MIVKGLLAVGIYHLREIYEYYEMCKKKDEPVARLDQANAYSEYTGVLDLLAFFFQVDKWYLDTLRACNDLKTDIGNLQY